MEEVFFMPINPETSAQVTGIISMEVYQAILRIQREEQRTLSNTISLLLTEAVVARGLIEDPRKKID
jgi:hypothetical protein